MGKAKTSHDKFAKFADKGGSQKKDRYRLDGSVCTGYRVIDATDNSVVLETEMMWDAIDKQRELNAPV